MFSDSEIIASFFVNILYNQFYLQACNYHANKNVQTLEDGYLLACSVFENNLQTNFDNLMKDFLKYYAKYSNKKNYGTTQNLDCVVQNLVPSQYFSNMDTEAKCNVFKTVVVKSFRDTLHFMTQSILSEVLSRNDKSKIIDVLRDKMISFLKIRKNALYQSFVMSATSNGNAQISQQNSMFMQIVSDKIKKLVNQKYSLIDKVNTLTTELKECQESNEQLRKQLNCIKKQTKVESECSFIVDQPAEEVSSKFPYLDILSKSLKDSNTDNLPMADTFD